MGERRYGVCSRRRSPSPGRQPPRSRDVNHSRHYKYSPYRGRVEEYSREAERAQRIEKRDHFDRDLNLRAPRFSEYDNRDRDKYLVGGRRSRSPRRVEKRDNFDRDMSMRPVRLSAYEDVGKGNYKSEVSVGRLRGSYGEDSYHGDLTKYQGDHLLDRSRTSDHLNMKDYSHTRGYNGSGYTNVASDGGNKDYYPYSHYSDSNRAGLLSVSQHMDSTKPSPEQERGGRMHSRWYTLAHGGADDVPLSNLSGNNGRSHMSSIASRYLNTDSDRQGYVHFRDELHLEKNELHSEKRDEGLNVHDERFLEKKNDGFHFQDGFLGMEKPVGREIYKFKKEDDVLSSRGYLKGDSDYVLSSSQPKDYGSVSSGILREGFPGYYASRDLSMSSHAIRPGSGLASEHISFDGYGEIHNWSGGQLDNTRSRSSLYARLPQDKQGDQLYAESDRSEIGCMSTRLNDIEEEYKDKQISRIDVLNPPVDESYHKRRIRDDGLWNQYPFSEVKSTRDKFDASGSRYVKKQDLEMLGTGSSHLNYGTREHCGYESVKWEEHHAEMDDGRWSYVERSDILKSRKYDPSFCGLYDSPRKRLALADLSLVEPSERRLSHKHVRDEILYEHDAGVRISTDGNGARKVYTKLGNEIDLVRFSEKPNLRESKYEETWRASHEMANDEPSSSKFDPSRVKLHKSDSRDIRKRLGPVSRKLHVSQRLAKKYKSSIKKRLAPAPPKKRANLPWLKNRSSKQTEIVLDDLSGSPHDHGGDHSGDPLSLMKPEPPENSEEFKQLVQSAFLKFLKQINQTPTKRKKYTEQGKAGSLMCIVCSSNSDEFAETESLAMHAFTSKKVGLRSQHLGLHKALCVLMGWKVTEEPGSEWHCEVMSNAEASVLKEDLIIWPPVVIVHNSTIDNKKPDERVIISTEKLHAKLRDMGSRNILKVCNGKPANQSVMLVKFNGTLSGLREAERYHSSYVDSKHGRADLKQLKAGGTQVISAEPAEEGENCLYGYLGIAEDLDSLDFDTKKRCVLRSKKAILSVVDAA
ncbi:hypothetical protein CDL12_01837 [Handroanthus impetiginosus]|uniref:XS domain-containing protein n=1 Tax=Handroanthus impetiginosus TaxID=429701 RepID=A0A2G9I6N0_9LAMI|nr:hypothetical protein CDL12_01837 [Handroanthus impetiginosus]